MEINTKLNSLIFNEILPYLSYNNSYSRILELSLISKQSFQIIQNLITHKHIIKLDPNDLIKSIKKSKENNNYELFLIKYKELESFHYISKGYSNKSLKKIKSELLEQCGQLKKVIFNSVHINFMEINPTCDQFYEFRGLHLLWDLEDLPCSDAAELELVEDEDEYYEFEFSFKFLSRYPDAKKISISTRTSDMDMNLEKLDGILANCCSKVENIKFNYHYTPHNFVEKVINSKSPAIKSFTARLGDEDTIPNITTLICSFDSFEAFLLHCNENHNITTLRVGWDTHYIEDYDENEVLVNALSNFFKNNKSSLRSIIFPKSSSEILDNLVELINKERNNNNNNIKNITFKILDSNFLKEI
ncbi:hypothetical protein DICPUDRAFT_157824 [Dictyostelium purpureum]|uniref:Uncharacterized protein n=1 Tax=Dictyostelium purpureum TaxID=5786 RepID=F1A034_DICPU|nr:uncharacterized protein DICPUDRAFT_157824 [Dictyostelium purpureum]EGC30448.1 hypothetical protein DICPUDRAFT_157824 [Dictyostelium purpureum]|eukprot:XP_003293027.1 hypothetical protein DICPUDRAFT_157824 [Dictyostelium purpureum]